jgi:hypothetical protein
MEDAIEPVNKSNPLTIPLFVAGLIVILAIIVVTVVRQQMTDESISGNFNTAALEARDAIKRLSDFSGTKNTFEIVKLDASKAVDTASRAAVTKRDKEALLLIKRFDSAVREEWVYNDMFKRRREIERDRRVLGAKAVSNATQDLKELADMQSAYEDQARACQSDIEKVITDRSPVSIQQTQCQQKSDAVISLISAQVKNVKN